MVLTQSFTDIPTADETFSFSRFNLDRQTASMETTVTAKVYHTNLSFHFSSAADKRATKWKMTHSRQALSKTRCFTRMDVLNFRLIISGLSGEVQG